MPWNEPGSNNNDPWDKDRKRPSNTQSPPDIDEVVKNITDKVNNMFGKKRGGGSGDGNKGGSSGPGFSGFSIGLIVVVAFAIWGFMGFYTIQEGNKGVNLRFGKYLDTKDAGLHWLPKGIDDVTRVDVQKVNTVEVGYRSSRTGQKEKQKSEALMLTQDENIIDVEFAIQYNIKDPKDLLFHVSEPVEMVVRQATESAVREVVGRNTMDLAITEGRGVIASEIKSLLQNILDRYSTGINIISVDSQNAQPPAEVKDAFDDVVKAREDQVRFKNSAQAYANDIIPRARGNAARVIEEAEGYKSAVLSRADGDAQRFEQILSEYTKAPGVTRDRLYIETMEEVFNKSSKLMINQKSGQGSVFYLPLDQILKQQQSGAGASNQTQSNSSSNNSGLVIPDSRRLNSLGNQNTTGNVRPARGTN